MVHPRRYGYGGWTWRNAWRRGTVAAVLGAESCWGSLLLFCILGSLG
ncbi:hypothetical protein V6Z11_D10G103200 [Gossypium hirsutum]